MYLTFKGVTGLVLLCVLMACGKGDKAATYGEDFFYLRNNGADMPVFVEGNFDSNTFIVVLHGGPGGNDQIYNSGLSVLSDSLEILYRMVYYDQRGSGTASGNYSNNEVQVNQYVNDLSALIQVLHNKYGNDITLFLMGHSWGGTLGTAYLIDENRQNAITGWIEVDGAHNFLYAPHIIENIINIGTTQISVGNHIDEWQTIVDFAEGLNPNEVSSTDLSTLNQHGYTGEGYLLNDGILTSDAVTIDPLQYLSDGISHSLNSPYNPLTGTINMLFTNNAFLNAITSGTLNFSDDLHKITIPCAFFWGKYDMVVPIADGYDAFDKVSTDEKRMVVFESSGHSPMINETNRFLEELIDFVETYQ
jgi:pimeloyl-ACP methyl ester carboxylesterase